MDYSNELTKAKWIEKKGLVMKVLDKTTLEKTDMGKELDKMHSAYKGVDWANLSAKSAYDSPAEIDEAEHELPNRFKAVVTFKSSVTEMLDHAKKVLPVLRSHKFVPSKVGDYVALVITKCADMEKDLDGLTMPNLTKGYEDARQNFAAKQKVMAAQLAGWIPKIKAGIQIVQDDPTGATYGSKLWQSVRGLGVAAGKYDFLQPVQPEWKVISSLQPGTLTDKNKVLAHLLKIEALVEKTEPLMP
ncbi:MAG TPA: hypothetical protein VHW09_04700 [Bryobacteraceae bacterium]|jgi:hypothetical protein|nr:hypothetical protein [Bryobacteraceae bacterium]